nr:hypothetical protein [Pseudo-nitzschia hainanensis]
MKIKKLSYIDLDCGPITEGLIEVRVTLDNDTHYSVDVGTPTALATIMKGFKTDFIPPSGLIIVSKLTDNIIYRAIEKSNNFRIGNKSLLDVLEDMNLEDMNEEDMNED